MYTIKTEDFNLQLTPGADSLMVDVRCDGFSGHACFDMEDFLIADFILQIKEMYENLEGSAKLQDLYETDGFIEFSAQKFGHILVRGKLVRMRQKLTQQIQFEYELDQSYLKEFVMALAAGYSRYSE